MLWLIATPLVLFAAVVLVWQLRYPTHTYRYKLTVEVETPEGLRTGYAVREITWLDGPNPTPEITMASLSEVGEAVAVDLPNGEVLFALLYSNNQGATANLAFGSARQTKRSSREVVEVVKPDRANPVWGQDGFPRLVRFEDLNDPLSAQRIDPNDLSATFGEGYSLKRITAEISDEPITEDLTRSLLAYGWKAGRGLDQRTRLLPPSPTVSQQLTFTDFSRGITK